MKDYSHSELMSMQQDAIRRVQEMQRRSQEKVQQSRRQPAPESERKPPQQKKEEGGALSPVETILRDLKLDHDRLMILGLLLVLINEGGDRTLILALCYLLF